MTERIWKEEEIAALRQSEPQLASRGMYTTGELGDYNATVFLKYFELHPDIPVTVDILLRTFEALKEKNLIHVKGEYEFQFEKTSQRMNEHERNVLESFMKRNRLWADGDDKFSNACLLISALGGRPFTYDNLAHFALPYVGNLRGKTLVWVTPGHQQNKTYGSHSGNSAHFAPKSESNQNFSHRVVNNNTQIPRPEASNRMNDVQWTKRADALCADSGRHSDTASIQRAVKAVRDQGGTAEAAYWEGVRVKNQIRMEQERGR